MRLIKYLIPVYYDELFAALVSHVDKLQIVSGATAAAGSAGVASARRAALSLEALYGEGVFPQGLLQVLNAGYDRWEHWVPEEDEAAYRAAPGVYEAWVRGRLVEILRKHLLHTDERPTYTRMFTFNGNLMKVLCFAYLGIHGSVLRFVGVQPREENQTRLVKVHKFYQLLGGLDYLKRTSLALQLTLHTHSICAKQDPDALPVLVQLAQGRVCQAVLVDFERVVASLSDDTQLDVSAAVTLLFSALLDILTRFKQHEDWPYLVFRLCQAYDADFEFNCLRFLRVPDDQLDPGFSLQLKKLALAQGSAPRPMQYLVSGAVQRTLHVALAASSASSLPAERRFAEAKKAEAPRLCHVAVTSRNHILRQFLRWRDSHLERLEAAERSFRAASKTNVQSLAWAACSQDLPRPGAGSTRQQPLNTGGDPQVVKRYRHRSTSLSCTSRSSPCAMTRRLTWMLC